MSDPLIEKMYRVEEVAKIFDVKPYTIREWIRNGKIQAIKLDTGRFRVYESEIRRFVNERHGAAQ